MSPSCRGVRGAPSRPPAHPVGGAGAWLLGGLWLRRGLVGVGRREPLGRGRVRPSRRRPLGAATSRWPGSRPSGAWRQGSSGLRGPLRPLLREGGWACRRFPQQRGPAGSGASGGLSGPVLLRASRAPASSGRSGASALPWTEEAAERPAGAAGPAVSAPKRGRGGRQGRRRPEPGGSLPSGQEARPRCRRLPLACRRELALAIF